MKVKFTKLAALLLAGAALFATGCTDYEVDIQKVDKKVDDLASGKVATLESQVAALQATVATLESAADHKADIDKLNKTISDLQAALQAAIDLKVDQSAYDAKVAEIEKRIKDIEDADFQKQINDIITAMNNAMAQVQNDIAAAKAELEKKIADLELALTGKINALEVRVKANEDAIKDIKENLIPALQEQIDNINNVVIPKINQDIEDLQNGKLDKSEFEEYKAATAKTLQLMQSAIQDLTDLTAGFPEDKTIKEYIDEADQALADDISKKYLEVVAKAFGSKEAMDEMEGNLLGRLEACEKLLAGDWGEQTVKQYIDAEAKKLQDQIDEINSKVAELDSRLAAVEKSVNEVILPELEFAIGYEGYYTTTGGLQGYIQDWAIDAYLSACDYADEWGNYLFTFIDDLYTFVSYLQERIQSIVYVPDYDDLKITTNMAYVIQPVDTEEEVKVSVIDQPFWVTYKITPAYYASSYAYYYFDNFAFDVKPLKTRDSEETDAEPAMEIIGLDWADDVDETGEIKFLVQPINIASAEFAANGIKPNYSLEIYDQSGSYILGGSAATMYSDEMYFGGKRLPDNYDMNDWVIGVYSYEDLKAYEARAAFAASLRFTMEEPAAWNHQLNANWGLELDEDDDWISEYNDVASPYNVLYPGITEYTIQPDPYKKLDIDEDEDGNLDVRAFLEEEVHQTLPYNTLRKENPAEDEDPGYRVILEDAVPAVQIGDKVYGLYEEDLWNGFHVIFTSDSEAPVFIPQVTISDEAEIEYIKGGENEPVEDNYIVDPTTYAEVEMNGEEAASNRKLEIGNLVQGTYTFTSAVGEFTAFGDVLIVKEQGSIDVSAEAVWTWNWNKSDDAQAEDLGDALVDHNIFYGEEGPTEYVRIAWPVTIDEAGAEKLMTDLGVSLADFAGLEPDPEDPKAYIVEVADRLDEEGEEIADDALVFEALAEDADFVIENVAIEDDELVADFKNFDWDKVYKITAVYELPEATITVNGIFKTYDRNREMVTLPKYEYTFGINEFDEETGFGYIAGEDGAAGYYYWKSDPMHKPIFEVFDAEGVINVRDNVDFEFDADQEDFNECELNTWLRAYNEEPGPGTAWAYVDINRNGIYGETKSGNAEISAQSLKDMNSGVQDPDDPYVYLGNVIYRYVTTYIGEVVEIPFQFNYRVPAYDFLHQPNYTFDDGKWYTMASPKYDYNKQALKKYDVAYMNVPALAFNIIDENKRYFNYKDEVDPESTDYFYNEALKINFFYTGPDTVDDTELEEQSATDELTVYGDLWFNATDEAQEYSVEEADNYEHTVFYYRSIRDAIPMYGTLEIECDGVRFEIPTSFEVGSKGKYIASDYVEGGVEYSNYELRAWKPFYVPTYSQKLVVKLDEHGKYNVNVLEGLQFFDGRQVAASAATDEVQDPFVEGTYSIDAFNNGTKSYFRPMLGFNTDDEGETKWGWIVGNVDNDDASTKPGNGYAIDAPTSWDAYDLQEKSFVFDKTGVPMDLRRLIDIDEENYTMVFDYNSQIQFSDTAQISFSFDLQSPWQKFEKPFSVIVEIQGLNVQ